MIKFFFLLCLIAFGAEAARTPESKYGFENGVDLRVMKKVRRYLLLLESKNRKELTDHDYNQLMMGSYYRLTKRFRMGAFIQAEQGLRWDQDWQRKNGVWQWQNMNSRWDFSSVLDATYSDHVTKSSTWEMKSRLFYYHSRDSLQLRLRPGYRYFILKHGLPVWQIFTELEAYIPVNYGTRSLYEYWLYLGALYQFNSKFGLGPVISFRERWFHEYEDSSVGYKSKFQSTYFGLNALYHF